MRPVPGFDQGLSSTLVPDICYRGSRIIEECRRYERRNTEPGAKKVDVHDGSSWVEECHMFLNLYKEDKW